MVSSSSSIEIVDENPILKVVIPSPKRFSKIAFSVVQACIFIGGIVFLGFVYAQDEGPGNCLLPFIGLWIAVGLSYVVILLWDLVGKTIILISDKAITLRYQLFAFYEESEYLAEHIKDLRFSTWVKPYDDRVSEPFIYKLSKISNAPLAFDYGAKTIRFGNNIVESEARQIVALIHQGFPQYR